MGPLPSREVLSEILPFFIGPKPAFQCRDVIPSSLVGVVLGKQGKFIKQLEQRHGVRLMVVPGSTLAKAAIVASDAPSVKREEKLAGTTWAAIVAGGKPTPVSEPLGPRRSGSGHCIVGWLIAE